MNAGKEPIKIEPDEIEAAAAGRVMLQTAHPTVVEPGEMEVVRFTGTLDPFTPPGTYEAKITVNGVEEAALLEVTEHVSLSLSDTELVVFAEAGQQHRRMIATNRGNIVLRIRRLGPVELEYDPPRSLLGRIELILERRYAATSGPRDSDEPVPTVEAWLENPVELAPGETGALDWTIAVNGALQPGLRYRAAAALYTSNVMFVVTPAQDGLAPPASGAPGVRTESVPRPDEAPPAPASGRKRRPS